LATDFTDLLLATKALRHEEFSDGINDSNELVEVKMIVIKQK